MEGAGRRRERRASDALPPPPPPQPPGASFPGGIQLPPLIKMAKCTRPRGFLWPFLSTKVCKTIESSLLPRSRTRTPEKEPKQAPPALRSTVGQPDPGPRDPRMPATVGTTVARWPKQRVRSQMSVPRNTLHRAKGKQKWIPVGNAD